MKAKLEIVQIAVRLPDGGYGVVALPSERAALLLPMIEALSDGRIKVVPVPEMKLVPIAGRLPDVHLKGELGVKKVLTAFAVAALMAAPAAAEKLDRAKIDSFCETSDELARAIMDARQAGVPMVKMIQTAEGNELIELIVEEAFKTPQYHGSEYRQREINQFGDKVYRVCRDSLKKRKKN